MLLYSHTTTPWYRRGNYELELVWYRVLVVYHGRTSTRATRFSPCLPRFVVV